MWICWISRGCKGIFWEVCWIVFFTIQRGGIGVYLGVCCLVFCTIQGGYWGIFGSLLDSILYYTGVLGVFGSLLDSILHFLYYRGGWVSKIEICYKVLIHAVVLYMDPPCTISSSTK